MLGFIDDIQGGDQDNNQNNGEVGANTSATMSVERQRFGGDKTG